MIVSPYSQNLTGYHVKEQRWNDAPNTEHRWNKKLHCSLSSLISLQRLKRYRLDSYGRRCFAVAGPSTWNSLPDCSRLSCQSQRVQASAENSLFCEIL